MEKLKEFLRKEGASLVGYADMSEDANCGWKSGISIGMKIDCSIVNSIEDGPNMEYYHEYYRLNNKLDKLTEIDLPYDKPISESLCGNCSVCKTQCPGEAISGKNWNVHIDRDEFFNALDCRRTARQLSLERMDKQITLCGKCIVACPYTQKYLQRKIV